MRLHLKVEVDKFFNFVGHNIFSMNIPEVVKHSTAWKETQDTLHGDQGKPEKNENQDWKWQCTSVNR